jgi:hypothetical protein
MPGATDAGGAALMLPDVTLAAVTSVALKQTVHAMTRSLEQVRFGAAILISDRSPPAGTSEVIQWKRIDPIRSHLEYSRFMLRDLCRFVSTSHVLCVQWDGYVLDAKAWDPSFLEYDYVGAAWPHFSDGHDVGNGGFSLRSRRLLDACVVLGVTGAPEDVAICRTFRPALEREHGIRFAPAALARRFAYERFAPCGGEFGFHGAFNLIDLVDRAAFDSLLAELEPAVLNRSEHRELLKEAVRRGRFRLAGILLRRMLSAHARR